MFTAIPWRAGEEAYDDLTVSRRKERIPAGLPEILDGRIYVLTYGTTTYRLLVEYQDRVGTALLPIVELKGVYRDEGDGLFWMDEAGHIGLGESDTGLTAHDLKATDQYWNPLLDQVADRETIVALYEAARRRAEAVTKVGVGAAVPYRLVVEQAMGLAAYAKMIEDSAKARR
jgi:hypothetical protein